ncbi:MAG: hypothetical protein JXR97_10580 [Planctomycetes bacterium]|nr:hypothetical protein [Planctomycetota bacterium]
MSNRYNHRLTCLVIPLMLCILSLAGELGAGEKAKVVLSRFGFSNRIPNGAWSPLITKVENEGGKAVNAGIVTSFQVGGEGKEEVAFSRKITIPPYTERTVESFVLMDYPPDAMKSIFNVKEYDIEFKDGTVLKRNKYQPVTFHFDSKLVNTDSGQVLSHYTFNGLPVYPGSILMSNVNASVDPYRTQERYTRNGLPYAMGEHRLDTKFCEGNGETPFSGLFANTLMPSEDDLGGVLQVLYTNINDLPRKWAAYESVDLILMGSQKSREGNFELSPQKRHSLLRYIKSGGKVVVMPLNDIESYRHPFWQQLMPVRILGKRLIDDELGVLEKKYGKKIVFDRNVPPEMVEAIPGDGEVVLSSGDRVLIAKKNVGSGEVWFVAFNGEALSEWSNGHLLFSDILKPNPSPAPGLKISLPRHAETFLGQNVGIEAPSRVTIVILLSAYFLLSAGLLFGFKLKGRSELAWPGIIILSIVAFAITFIIKERQASKIGFVVGEIGVTVLESGEPEGSATSFVGLFSPKELTSDIKWKSPDTLASIHSSWEGDNVNTRSLKVEEKNNFTFEQVKLNPMEMSMYRAMTMVKYGDGIDFNISLDSGGIKGTVVNRTGKDLEDCVIRLNQRCVNAGNIPDKGKFTFTTKDLIPGILPSSFAKSDEQKTKDYILAEIFRFKRSSGMFNNREFNWPLTFIGWSRTAQASLAIGAEQPKERPMQLILTPAPEVKASGKVVIPAGVCGLKILKGGSSNVYGDPENFQFRSYENIKWPEQTRIAGMKKSPPKKNTKKAPAPPGGIPAGGPIAQKQEKPKTADELFAPTGWLPQTMANRLRIGFDLPPRTPAIKINKVKLVVDIEIRDASATLGIRKAGETSFQKLGGITVGSGRTEKVIPNIGKYIGPNGELPEFEVNIRKPLNAGMDAKTFWKVKEFDIEVEGTANNSDEVAFKAEK